MVEAMKIFFSIMLIFLFLSCSGGKKTPESVISDEDGEQDIDIVDDDDDEFVEDEESDDEVTDTCETEPCKGVENSTGECIDEDKGYSCECLEKYGWSPDDKKCLETRTAECTGLPENAEWHGPTSITQMTRDGEEWFPSTEGTYRLLGECKDSCCFRCIKNYTWLDNECLDSDSIKGQCSSRPCKDMPNSTGVCKVEDAWPWYSCECIGEYNFVQKDQYTFKCMLTRTAECTGLPEHAEFYSGSSITQLSDDGEKWSPSTTAVWNSRKCNNLCCFKCSKTYFWTGNECINLCDADPCKGVAHSTEECTSVNAYDYACGCEEGYYWWGPKRGCIAQKPASGNICTGAHECFNNSEKIECPASGEDFYGQDAQYAAAGACVLKAATSNIEFDESVFETLTVSGDEVITDSTTGFMWQKNSDFNGEQREWRQALNYCENLVYAGYSDWRLPNKNELLSLVNYKNDNPDSDFSWFEDETNQYYFSSSTARYYKEVSVISSIDGNIADINKTGKDYQSNKGSVRCVRSDICGEGLFLKDSECVRNPCKAKSCEVANSTGVCIPKTELSYECQCVDGYFWNGSKCVNPCDADPCSKIANSDKNCTPVNSTLYFCGCNDGYGWNSGKCTAYATDAVTLGNICTGDIVCFDKGFKIECPAENESYYGQDAQYAASGSCKKQEFELKTVSNQEIVVDKNTKLEWQHAVSEKTYTWNDALSYCDNLVYAGYSDWRVPEPLELMTITDYSAYDSCEAGSDEYTSTLVNRLYFKDIMPSFAVGSNLWTSKENLDDSSRAWGFSPKHGHVYSYPLKTYRYNVMCVRGNKLPKANFTNKSAAGNFASALIDLTTGLMWQKSFTKMENETWENALSYCENLTHSGYSDWRLPNKNELVSLISYDKDDPFSILFNIPDEYGFVSSTTRRIDINPASSMDCVGVYIYGIEIFDYAEMINLKGELKGKKKSKGSFNVRCVRNFE